MQNLFVKSARQRTTLVLMPIQSSDRMRSLKERKLLQQQTESQDRQRNLLLRILILKKSLKNLLKIFKVTAWQ